MGRPDRRNRLVQTAVDLFWEHGFHTTGVDELCMHADARKGSFYHFFPSKTDLAIAAIEARWAATRALSFDVIARTGRPGLDRIRRLVEFVAEEQAGAVRTHQVFLGSPFGAMAQEAAHRDERLRVALLRVFDEQCLLLRSWLDEGVTHGEIPAGDTLSRARNILALLEGGLLLAKVADDVELFRAVAQAVPELAGGRGSR